MGWKILVAISAYYWATLLVPWSAIASFVEGLGLDGLFPSFIGYMAYDDTRWGGFLTVFFLYSTILYISAVGLAKDSKLARYASVLVLGDRAVGAMRILGFPFYGLVVDLGVLAVVILTTLGTVLVFGGRRASVMNPASGSPGTARDMKS